MKKTYDISKKSDMRKLAKDIEKEALSIAENQLMSESYEVQCPHCNVTVTVPTGLSLCPVCRNEINLTLDITYD